MDMYRLRAGAHVTYGYMLIATAMRVYVCCYQFGYGMLFFVCLRAASGKQFEVCPTPPATAARVDGCPKVEASPGSISRPLEA